MKFNDLFRNRRNIYFVSLIIMALLLAGAVWQYNNYIGDKMAELDFENQLKELDKVLDQADDMGVKIIESAPAADGSEEPIKEVANTDPGTPKPKKPSDVKGPTAKTENAKTENAKATSAPKSSAVNIDTMILPAFGSIALDFSDTELVYSKTIESWVTHSGLDLKAEEGSTVRAALDGVVAEKLDDPQWGLTIILDHGNGISTKYSNLSTLDLVSKGQQIKKGDVISGIGRTAICEILDEPHLHFELIKDNQNIDPKNYLPKKLK